MDLDRILKPDEIIDRLKYTEKQCVKGYYYILIRPDVRDRIIELLKEQETTDTKESRIFNCKKCGYGIDDIFLSDEKKYKIIPNYCPNCGRSVNNE